MRIILLPVLFGCLTFPYHATAQEWKNECVGYYQLQLPDNIEVALYPVKDFVEPKTRPETRDGILVSRYADVGVTFDETYERPQRSAIQAQFSEFYYGNYELGISSESNVQIDFTAYQKREKESIDFGNNVDRQYEAQDFKRFNKSMTPQDEFDRKHGYILKNYLNAFSLYENRGYTLYVNEGGRLYHFWSKYKKDTGDKSQTAEKQVRDSEPEVLSLLNRFRPRKLYEVPAEQGFCMPYGFIAGDSGHEPRNMGVTYRLKDHPDVTIFFQDFGMNGEILNDKDSVKDAVTRMWNNDYLMGASKKELQPPKWQHIKMDGRDGMGTFVKATYSNVPVYDYNGHVAERLNYINYGYLAYIRGDKENRNNEPDLILYVSQSARQAKGKPPMGKDELKKMAEHIVGSVKKR